MVLFSNRLNRIARVATLVMVFGVQQVSAEIIPATAERITQLSQAFGRLGLEGEFPQASVVASDMLFVLEELERLSELAGQIENDLAPCGNPKSVVELTLEKLGSPECLTVLLGAERARWRMSAELSAQIHVMARHAVIESLPLVGLEGLDDEARETATAWWHETGPATLEAYARIGREWIKKVEAESEEDVEEARAEILDALDRIALEPGSLRLRQVLSQTPGQEALREAFLPLVEKATSSVEQASKLKAAARFAGVFDGLMSQHIHYILGQDPVDTCSSLQDLGMQWDRRLPSLETHCVSAVKLMQSLKREGGELAAEVFQQELVLAFEERILTIRLLLAKLGRVNTLEDDASCSDAMGLLNASLEDRGRRPLGGVRLDRRLTEEAAGGFARLSRACLADTSPRWLAESCAAGRDPEELTAVFARMPERIGSRLKPKWSALIEVANDQTLGRMCNDPIKFLKDIDDGSFTATDDLHAAVEDLKRTAKEVTWQASLGELRPYLDGFELPVRVFDDLVDRADLLCSEIVESLPPDTSDIATKAETLTSQMLRATLVDTGVLSPEGKRPEQLTTLCQVLSKRERARDGTPLLDLLEEAEKDAEAISAPEVVDWTQSIMDRLSQNGERIAKRFAAGLVIAEGVDQVRQAMAISDLEDGNRRCNASGSQQASLAPGIKISGFTSQLDASDPNWKIAISAKVNLMLCGPTPPSQENSANGIADGQMQRARSLETGDGVAATVNFELDPIVLDPLPNANEIAEDFVSQARSAAKNIEFNEDALLKNLTDYLRVAGISDLNVIRGFEIPGVEFEWDERGWARVRTTIESPLSAESGFDVSSVELCLLLPVLADEILDEDTSCMPINRLEEKMAELLMDKMLAPILNKVLSDLGMALQGSFKELGIIPEISSGYARTDGSSTPTVVSKIVLKSEDLKKLAGFEGAELAPFSGDLVVNVRIPPDGHYEIETALPRLSDDYFFSLIPEISNDDGFIHLVEIPKLPSGASNREKERCDPKVSQNSPRRIYRLALSENSPIIGVLGFVCLELNRDPYFVAPKSGELRTPDDAWRFVFQTGDDIEFVKATDGDPEGLLRIELELRVSEPSFEELDGRSVAVEFNVKSGAWRLPADARANRAAYSIIEEQVSRQLPQGIRVYGVEFSSDGVRLLLSPPDVEQVFANLENGVLSDVDLDALQSIANTACDVAPLLGLAEMIHSGVKIDALPGCDYDPLVHEIDIRSAEIAWSCTETGINDQLRSCDIVFDDELTICEDRLNIGVTWDVSRNPEFEDDELIECLEDHVAGIFPDTIGPRIKVDPPSLSTNCVAEPARCRLTTAVNVDFTDAFADVDLGALGLDDLGLNAATCGGLSAELVASMNAEIGFNGTSRLEFGGGSGNFDAALNQCVADISVAVAGALAADLGADIDDVLEDVATKGRELLLETSARLNDVTGEAVDCRLVLRDGSSPGCEELSKDTMREGSLRGARFASEYPIFETNVEVSVGFAFELAALSPESLLAESRDLEKMWRDLRDSAAVTFDLGCKDQSSSACLSQIGNELAKDLPNGIVSYDGGLQIEPGRERTAIKIPLRVRYEEFGVDLPVVVDCGLETPGWDQISLNCSSDPEAVILEAVAQALATIPHVELDLGLASVSLSDPEYKADLGLVSMKAVASFEGLDLLPEGFDKAQGTVTIGRDLEPDVQIGWDALVNGASEHLAEAVNGLVGDFLPVKIISVEVAEWSDSNGAPKALAIESEATIIEVISLSAPRVVLSEDGLKIDGPNRFSIGLPDGFSIPVPPIAICPNGGAIEDKELTLTANITIGECTASGILKFAGSVTVFLDRPRVETLGKLVILTVLPLGHSEGVFDLGERIISHQTEIGGVMSDIIRMRTEFNANGKLMTVTANGDIDVFKTRVGEGNFDLNLDTGVLNSGFNADLGFAQGNGFVRTQAGFSRPEAEIDGHMGIGGFPIMGSFIKARARFAKVGVSVFGLRLAVAFPGLDLLDPSKIADLLKDLLTPNFENLDEALEALLSGNITMNPFADFGSGGDGMGDSSDGDAGESAGGDGAKDGGDGDPGKGLGNEAAPAEATPPDGPAPSVPPEGVASGGLAGTETAPLWFVIDQATKHVRIGTGTQGGDDEKVVALAIHDTNHFDQSGARKGKTLVLLERGYTQILPSDPFVGEPCEGAGQPDRIVVLYAGTDAPRQGMYELCRLRDANGMPVTESSLGQADKETLRDVASLQDALAAELLSRREQVGHDHGRIVLKARLVNAGGASEMRGALAFQRPGELLVVMRGRFKQSKCGEAAEADATAEPASKIFILKGFGAADLNKPETVLKAVRSVWGCDPGSLARFDPKTKQLATSSTISQEGEAGFNVVAELPEIETPEQPSSPWATTLLAEVESLQAEQRKQEERDQRNEELRAAIAQSQVQGQVAAPACEGECEPLTVKFEPAGARCRLTVNAETYDFTRDNALFKDDCNPARSEFTWVALSPPIAILSAEPGAEPAQIELGLFNMGDLGKSNPLGLGIVMAEYTFEQNRFLSELPRFAASNGGRIQDLKGLFHPSGQLAAVLPGSGGKDSHWLVLSKDAQFEIAFTGPDLETGKDKALLPHLAPGARTAEVRDNGDVIIETTDAYHLLRWSGENWQLVFKLDRSPGQDKFEDHTLVYVSDIAADLTWKRDARLVPFSEKLGGWGFAAVDRDTGTGDLILKPVAEPTLETALQPIATWQGPNRRSDFQPGKFFWLKLELPPELPVFRVTSVHSSIDSVICLYDANLEYLAGDDDSHAEGTSAQLEYRVDAERPSAWLRISEYGKNEDLPADLEVALEKIDTVMTSGDPRSECENKHVEIPEPDYFAESFIETKIAGLIAAKDDPNMLATLANGVLGKTLPDELELIAVPGDGGRTLSYVTFPGDEAQNVLRPDAATLEFKPFLTLRGDPPPNTGTLVRAIGEILFRFGETERTLSGRSIVVEGVQAWSVTTVHNEETRQLLFLEQGDNNATIGLNSPTTDDGILADIVRYVTTNDWPTVTDVQGDPLVLEVRTRACATADCPRKLVHLGTEPGEPFPQTVIGDNPVNSQLFERWLEVFTEIVALDPGAAFNQEVYQGSGVDGLDAFRLLRSGPLYLVGPGGWACADVRGLNIRGQEMHKLLAAMAGNFDPDWQTSPAKFCETPQFQIDAGPSGGPEGVLLTRFSSDGRFSLLRVPLNNPSNAALTEPSTKLPTKLSKTVREEFSARLRAQGAAALASMDLLDEIELPGKRHAWVFGDSAGTVGIGDTLPAWTVAFMYPNPRVGEADQMLPCLLTGISVALPPNTDRNREVVHAALDSIRPAVEKADSCIGVNGAVINVRANPDGSYSAFFQEIRRHGALTRPSSSAGIRLASVMTPMIRDDVLRMLDGMRRGLHQVSSKASMAATFTRDGTQREILVDLKALDGLLLPAQSNLMRQIVRGLDGLSQQQEELGFTKLELDCASDDTCHVLVGRWPKVGWVAVELDAAGARLASVALASGRRSSKELAIDLAHQFSSEEGTIFEVLESGSRQMAADVLGGAVRIRDGPGTPWVEIGSFPGRAPGGLGAPLSPANFETIRSASLRRILEEGVKFHDPQWLFNPESTVGVAIAFERSGLPLGLVPWETIMRNGASGPLYWRDANEPLPVDDIADHVTGGKLLGGSQGIWLPNKQPDNPQVLVPLSGWSEQEVAVTSLYTIKGSGAHEPRFSFLPDCRGGPNRLRNLVAGLSGLPEKSSGSCGVIDGDLTLLVSGSSPSRGLVALADGWQWFDVDLLESDRESAMHAFATAMPFQEPASDLKLAREKELSLILGFAAHGEVWWQSPAGTVARLGRFSNVDTENESHRLLLSRVATLDLPEAPENGQIIGEDPLLRADLSATRTAILGTRGLIDLSTFDARLPELPRLPDRYLEEGVILLRQDEEFPVLFEMDAGGMVVGQISIYDENKAWHDVGVLDQALNPNDARQLADKLIEVSLKYKRAPRSVDRFSNGSFVICQDGLDENVDVLNWQGTPALSRLGIAGIDCSDPMISGKRVVNAFHIAGQEICSPGNELMFKAGENWFLGSQEQSGPTKTGCLFTDPIDLATTPICKHFPVQHPARVTLASLYGSTEGCKQPELTNTHALVELEVGNFRVVSKAGTRALRLIGADPEFVRTVASPVLHWVSEVSCHADLTLLHLPTPTSIALLENPCHAVSYLDGGQVTEMLIFEAAERAPMQEELYKKIGEFAVELRDLAALEARYFDDYVLIQLRQEDVLVLGGTVGEARIGASISDSARILPRISNFINQPTHVLYRMIDNPSDQAGPNLNVASLFPVDELDPLDQELVTLDHAVSKAIGWLDANVREIKLGFPLFELGQVSPVTFEWIRQQSLGQPSYDRLWLMNDQPRFFVVVRDGNVFFNLIANEGLEACRKITWERANDIFANLSYGPERYFFSATWPSNSPGEPGWYVPLSQDPRLALYDAAGQC